MADQSLEKQVLELRAQCEASKAENEKIKTQIAEAKDQEFAQKISDFKTSADTSQATIDELNELIKSTQARVAELEDSLSTSIEQLSVAKTEVEDMKQKEKSEKREAALVEAGLDEEEIVDQMASLATLDDSAFDSVVALMLKKKANFDFFKKGKDKDKDKKDDKDKDKKGSDASETVPTTEGDATPELFAGAETSEAALVVTEPENERELARANISDWFAKNVLNKS